MNQRRNEAGDRASARSRGLSRLLVGVVAIAIAFAGNLHAGGTLAAGSHGSHAHGVPAEVADVLHSASAPCDPAEAGGAACPATDSCAFCVPVAVSVVVAAPVKTRAALKPAALHSGAIPARNFRPPRLLQSV